MSDYYDDDNEGVDLGSAIKQSIKELAEETQAEQVQKQMEAASKEQNQIFSDALTEAGLDQEAFNELVQLDPQGTKQAFKSHVQSYVKTVARKRDPKTGQFLKGKPQQNESVQGFAGRPSQPQQKRYDPKKSRGTSEDMTNLVLDVLGDDPMFDI